MKKTSCIYCKSIRIVKRGFRYNDSGKKQLFLCTRCKRKMTFEHRRMRFSEKEIQHALKLYKRGMSLSEVQLEMRRRNVKVSRWSISLWSRKF